MQSVGSLPFWTRWRRIPIEVIFVLLVVVAETGAVP